MNKISRRLRLQAAAVLLAGLGLASLAFIQVAAPAELLKVADEMVREVVRIRGLQAKSPIQMGVKSKAEISKYLEEHVRKDNEESDLQNEGKMLRLLGLIPATLDYKDFALQLLTEQVGGYYDPDQKTFFIASWLPAVEQKPVMAHELTHALQDQYFDLNKILREERKLHDDDTVLARQAIFEGDAMAVMLDFLLAPAKRSFASLPDLVFVMRSQFTLMDSQFAVFKSAPVYLKETLLFPYGYGAAFLQRVWNKNPSWDAINKIYADLPVSTEQIIHPEKYLETRDEPKKVEFEDPATILGAGWKTAYRNVLGEFTLDLLLREQLIEERAKRAAAGWGGDQVLLLENEAGKNAVFVATAWDTADEADEFYQALSDWLQKKYPKAPKSAETPSGFGLIQNGGEELIRRDGLKVQFILGLPQAEAAKFGS